MSLERKLERLERLVNPPSDGMAALLAAAEMLRKRMTGQISQEEYERESQQWAKKHSGRSEPLFPSAAELRAKIAERDAAVSVSPPPPVAEPKPETKLFDESLLFRALRSCHRAEYSCDDAQ
jgi:hypothetical protein